MNEQALKERLKNIAALEKRTFNDVWRDLILERLLVRISRSSRRENFIFKGGLLLSHYIEIGRETKDADFLVRKLEASKDNIEIAFKEICNIKMDDGFTVKTKEISLLEQPHMNYPGFRASLEIKFGEKMRDRIQVDIGVGDIVRPNNESLELYQYKGKPIFEGAVSLCVYPVETIFAEKIETIISKGRDNSRMKDFHDLLLLCREEDLLKVKKVREDIQKTFENRKTKIDLPITFSKVELEDMQTLWAAHRQNVLGPSIKLDLPEKLGDLIAEVNEWLKRNDIF